MILFQPLVIVVNKADTCKIEDVAEEYQAKLKIYEEEGVSILSMSTLTDDGVASVKNTACEKLMAFRIETKSRNPAVQASLNKLNVTLPRPRDNKVCYNFLALPFYLQTYSLVCIYDDTDIVHRVTDGF